MAALDKVVVPSTITVMVGAPEHWSPLAWTVNEVTLDGKLTLPVAAPLLSSLMAWPADARESVITLAPDGKLICSASRVATNGAVAKER